MTGLPTSGATNGKAASWAKHALKCGFSPLPVGTPGWKALVSGEELDLGKKPTHFRDGQPLPMGWNRYKNERAMTEPEIDKNFLGIEYIGTACGKVSGNLEVIDFDKAGIYEIWADLLKENGHEDLLGRLVVQNTQTPGHKQVFYRCDEVEGNKHLAMHYTDNGEKKAAIETRGQGGYVVCYPSPGYTMYQGSFAKIAKITPDERRVLWDAARFLNEVVDEPKAPLQRAANSAQTSGGLRPGDDFNARADWFDLLSKAGGELIFERGGRQFWRRPGKTGRSWSATTGNGYGKDLMKMFSPNWSPFELEGVYDKFAAYALIEHGGDFAKAASQLAKQGYGEANPSRATAAASQANPVYEPAAAEQGEPETTEGKPRRFRFLTIDDIAGIPEKPMLIEGLLGERDLWMLFGASGSGKTFAIIDLLICAAVGGTWAGAFDCKRPLKVAYCYGEGMYGVPRRVMACLAYNELTFADVRDNLRFLPDVPQLFNKDGERSIWRFVEGCEEDGFVPDLFVLDTKSRATLGSKEEDNSEAAIVCDLLTEVANRMHCAPGFVHHTGWNSDHPRGASAYMGAMDLMLHQTLDKDTKQGTVALYKGKDIPPFDPLPFELEGRDNTAVINWRTGFDPGAAAISRVLMAMHSKLGKTWWTPQELATFMGDVTVDAVRVACFRESKKGDDAAVLWDGGTKPARYCRRSAR